jgi:hypothetical protein
MNILTTESTPDLNNAHYLPISTSPYFHTKALWNWMYGNLSEERPRYVGYAYPQYACGKLVTMDARDLDIIHEV